MNGEERGEERLHGGSAPPPDESRAGMRTDAGGAGGADGRRAGQSGTGNVPPPRGEADREARRRGGRRRRRPRGPAGRRAGGDGHEEGHRREERRDRRLDEQEPCGGATGADTDGTAPEVKRMVMDDGIALQYRDWAPRHPKGAVICVHGIRSHGAWYLGSCARLAERGYRVLFPDRRGSGLNRDAGTPGAERVARWVGDLVQCAARASVELRGKPVHLLGISWGGRIAAAAAAAGRVRVRSVVLSAPGIVALRDCSIGTKLSVAAALLLNPRRDFSIPLQDPALFTDDPDERNYIEQDQFGVRRASARFLFESRKLERLGRRSLRTLRTPLLLLLAGRDRIVDNAKTQRLFEKCPAADKVLKVYPEARHTLDFDACRDEYFNDLAAWFDAHG